VGITIYDHFQWYDLDNLGNQLEVQNREDDLLYWRHWKTLLNEL
jgi:hypothetical protein